MLQHRGVKVYYTFKNPWPMDFWYTTKPTALEAEGLDAHPEVQFDVRELPEAFIRGHRVDDLALDLDALRDEHATAIAKAIDAGFDLTRHAKERHAARQREAQEARERPAGLDEEPF